RVVRSRGPFGPLPPTRRRWRQRPVAGLGGSGRDLEPDAASERRAVALSQYDQLRRLYFEQDRRIPVGGPADRELLARGPKRSPPPTRLRRQLPERRCGRVSVGAGGASCRPGKTTGFGPKRESSLS